MKKLLYIIVFILLSGCSNNDNIDLYKEYPDINNHNKYAVIKNTLKHYEDYFVHDASGYNISCVNATNLIDIKEELQILNSNIVELINKNEK